MFAANKRYSKFLLYVSWVFLTLGKHKIYAQNKMYKPFEAKRSEKRQKVT